MKGCEAMELKRSIYVASADEETRKDIQEILTVNDIDVELFQDGKELLACYQEQPCDLAVLDLNLSISEDCHIYSVIQDLDALPAIFLTGSQSDIEHAIDWGGNWEHWFLKPFSKISFMMQICRIYRQQDQLEEDRSSRYLTIGDVIINRRRKFITIQGIASRLPATEYRILEYLMKHYDQPISRQELYEYVRQGKGGSEIHYSGKAIVRLRHKLMTSGIHIETIRGYGFRLKMK